MIVIRFWRQTQDYRIVSVKCQLQLRITPRPVTLNPNWGQRKCQLRHLIAISVDPLFGDHFNCFWVIGVSTAMAAWHFDSSGFLWRLNATIQLATAQSWYDGSRRLTTAAVMSTGSKGPRFELVKISSADLQGIVNLSNL